MKRITLSIIPGGLITAIILSFTSTMFAQNPLNISGEWAFDQLKSKAAEGTSFSGSEVTLNILHNQDSILVTKIIKNPGGMVDTTSEEYVLDGKEKITNEASLITKMTGKWSTDKKQIVLVQTVLLNSNIYTAENVYSLSDNGKVLTINSVETMNSKKSKLLLVYNKK